MASQAIRAPRITGQCEQCGSAFIGQQPNKRFCSDACQRRNHSAKPLAITVTCEGCGNDFRPMRTDRVRFCSRGCAGAERTKRRQVKYPSSAVRFCLCEECNRLFAARGPAVVCGSSCAAVRADARRRARIEEQRTARACAHCATTFLPAHGAMVYCSDRCARRSAKVKHGSTHRRRARGFGVAYEVVNPLRVFERDAWRCQECGCKTPRSLRGTTNPRAPELDHIQPMSRGGSHTYRNTRCTCRACNGRKGNGPGGQLLLFG